MSIYFIGFGILSYNPDLVALVVSIIFGDSKYLAKDIKNSRICDIKEKRDVINIDQEADD